MTLHVAHLVHSFSAGGLENVIAQLIDGLPHDRYRHTLLAVSSIDPAFAARVARPGVTMRALGKGPGQPYAWYPRMAALLRELRPDVLHSCNLSALDFVPVAWWCGVPRRVHAEHGWGADDAQGSNAKKRWMRRAYRPFVTDHVAVSAEIRDYLVQRVGCRPGRVHLIENGVDLARFAPPAAGQPPPADWPFVPGHDRVLACVGRLEPVKDHAMLLQAFAQARAAGGPAERLRLALVGDGPLAAAVRGQVAALGLADRVWLAGTRADVPALLRAADGFVLASRAEGTSCAVQEALASGLPVLATDVGANRRLLGDGRFGRLVPAADTAAMAAAMADFATAPAAGAAERARTAEWARGEFALERTLAAYDRLFSAEH